MTAALPDAEARAQALCDLDSTLLVEAGAGTGKTSLIAGRVTMLLASGVAPANIAAITFTEFAAAELGQRVKSYVDDLLDKRVPRPLRAVLPAGLSDAQTAALRDAAASLDGLTTTTIHGFCKALIQGYAIEADIDPGAEVIDADAATLSFQRAFDQWLTRRLGAASRPDDPVAILAREDPRGVVKVLWELAKIRRRHPSACPPPADLTGRPDLDLASAFDDLRAWRKTAPEAPFIDGFIERLGDVVGHYDGAFEREPTFAELWRLAHPPPLKGTDRKAPQQLIQPKTDDVWRKAAGPDEGPRWEAGFQAAFAAVDGAYRSLRGRIAGALLARLSGELGEVLEDYEAQKRAAAVLDFDDLLLRAASLLLRHPKVRAELSAQYSRLLIDEFQDTDPLQCDVIFRLAGTGDGAWMDMRLRPGGLFVVGDPKQSLYGFRGAEITTYEAAKAVVRRDFPQNLLDVTANFRSCEDILSYVNDCFAGPLSLPGQPNYVPLVATRKAGPHGLPCAAKLVVPVKADAKLPATRRAEATAVADACARLIGTVEVDDGEGGTRTATAGDIALLAPAGTDLWIYERALQARGLPFASQAGRSFFRRQEVQDLVALTRVLADADDTLAFGALLRGPLVGLTEEILLDITGELPEADGRPGRLSVLTPPEHVAHPEVKALLETLRRLRRRIRVTTPSNLLAEAIERLNVRPILVQRDPHRGAAANANVDLYLARAAQYGVRGLRRFAQDMTRAWEEREGASDGLVDARGYAMEIVTVHSAKGLEWPIVFLVNGASHVRRPDQFVHYPADDTLHWKLGDVVAPGLAALLDAEREEQGRERVRLWYVAATRARDLLVVPFVRSAGEAAYSSALDLAYDRLAPLDLPAAAADVIPAPDAFENDQDAETFAAEAERIAAASAPIGWLRPSDHDVDRIDWPEATEEDVYEGGETPADVEGGRIRGLVLHKLLEEVIGEGLPETVEALTARARELAGQFRLDEGDTPPALDAAELAGTVLATLALPDVAKARAKLRVEWPVYARVGEDGRPVAGRADAVAVDEGRVTAVFDWKSDVAPGDAQREAHADQLRVYLAATGAPRGALVYMSLGFVRWVELPARWRPA